MVHPIRHSVYIEPSLHSSRHRISDLHLPTALQQEPKESNGGIHGHVAFDPLLSGFLLCVPC